MDFESISAWAREQGYHATTIAMLTKLDEEIAEFKNAVETGKPHFFAIEEAADICIVLAAHYGDLLSSRIAHKMNINQNERKWFVKPNGTLGREK